MKYRSLKLYRNFFEEGTSKGSFTIHDGGRMYPQTRNQTYWGLASASFIPHEFKDKHNVIVSNKSTDASQLSAFFKFAKTDFNVFAEAVGMEIASCFNTKTSFNCPVVLTPSEPTLYSKLTEEQKSSPVMGSLVFSFLGRNETLFTFGSITHSEAPSTNIVNMCKTVDRFIMEKHHSNLIGAYQNLSQMSLSAKQDLCYQCLFRDCFGDVDYSTRNSGLIFNEDTGEIKTAPQFDFGELMGVLYSSKMVPPVLDSIENYAEHVRPFIKPEIIEKNNIAKIEKYNSSPTQLAQIQTLGDISEENMAAICHSFPEVAYQFLQDLNAFNQSNALPNIVEKYSGEDNLVPTEQGQMAIEFLNARAQIFSQQLSENLQQYAPADFLENMPPIETQPDCGMCK